MSLNPITREEKFLAKAGGEDVGELKPITRKEKFLAKIAGGGSGGAGGGGDVSWKDIKDKPFGETSIKYNEIFEVPTTDTYVRTAFTIEKFRYKLGESITWSYDDLNGQFKISKPVSLSTIFRHASVHLYVSLTETDEDGVYTLTLEIANMIGHAINFAVQYDYVDVKTLDPKFLPAGGGVLCVNVTCEGVDSEDPSNILLTGVNGDKTYEEIKTSADKGSFVFARVDMAAIGMGVLMAPLILYGDTGGNPTANFTTLLTGGTAIVVTLIDGSWQASLTV